MIQVPLLLGSLLASPLTVARAESPVFSVDAVWISRFEASSASVDGGRKSEVEARATELRSALETALGSDYVVVARQDVPAFADYSAEIYLKSCPPAQIYGCAYVVADRAKADWALAGTVAPGEGTALDITIGFVFVPDGRVVYSLGATVEAQDIARFAKNLVPLVHQVFIDRGTERDVREGKKVAPYVLDHDAVEAALTGLGDELKLLDGKVSAGLLERPKFTQVDLAEYEGRDDGTPWDRYGMDQQEYLRFRNAGVPLRTWREKGAGRRGQRWGSLGLGGGGGPFGSLFDARWALDPTTLNVVQVEQLQQTFGGGGGALELSVGIGVTPTLDVGLWYSRQGAPYQYRFHVQVAGSLDPLSDAQQTRMQGVFWGGQATWVPFPTSRARPRAQLGFSRWVGVPIDRVSQLPQTITPMAAPKRAFLSFGPGGELDLAKSMAAFADLHLLVPLSGASEERSHQGAIGLVEDPQLSSVLGVGFQLVVGVRLHTSRLWSKVQTVADQETETED